MDAFLCVIIWGITFSLCHQFRWQYLTICWARKPFLFLARSCQPSGSIVQTRFELQRWLCCLSLWLEFYFDYRLERHYHEYCFTVLLPLFVAVLCAALKLETPFNCSRTFFKVRLVCYSPSGLSILCLIMGNRTPYCSPDSNFLKLQDEIRFLALVILE